MATPLWYNRIGEGFVKINGTSYPYKSLSVQGTHPKELESVSLLPVGASMPGKPLEFTCQVKAKIRGGKSRKWRRRRNKPLWNLLSCFGATSSLKPA